MINLGAVVRALQQCRELACVQLALPVARLELAVHHLEVEPDAGADRPTEPAVSAPRPEQR